MKVPRSNHTATLVNENTIAIIGGETTRADSESESDARFSIQLNF